MTATALLVRRTIPGSGSGPSTVVTAPCRSVAGRAHHDRLAGWSEAEVDVGAVLAR